MNARLNSSLPGIAALLGLALLMVPAAMNSLYANFYFGAGMVFLFVAWVIANFSKKDELVKQGRWQQQTKAMIAMTLCLTMGFGLLLYYEKQMPKYHVALIEKELYRVPPQLNKKELIAMGAECNLEGNTLCSQAVFAKIVNLDSRNFQALANLAIAQSHLGFHKHAVQNFRTAIKNGVRSFDTYHFYGNSLLALKMKPAALKAFRISLKKNPNQVALKKKFIELSQN